MTKTNGLVQSKAARYVRTAPLTGRAPMASEQPVCERGHEIGDWMDAYCKTCIRLGLEDIPPQFVGEQREQLRAYIFGRAPMASNELRDALDGHREYLELVGADPTTILLLREAAAALRASGETSLAGQRERIAAVITSVMGKPVIRPTDAFIAADRIIALIGEPSHLSTDAVLNSASRAVTVALDAVQAGQSMEDAERLGHEEALRALEVEHA